MSTPRLPTALAPMRHTAYRWLATSLTFSLVAQGVWVVALVWQVVALGGGPRALSAPVTAGALGMLATALLGGVLADRLSKRRILLTVGAMQAVALGSAATLSLAGVLAPWHLVVVAAVGGVAGGLYYPAYSALLPMLVPGKELLAANGFEGILRPVLMQAAGPALASALVAAYSPGAALALASVAAMASAAALVRVPDGERVAPDPARHPVTGFLRDVAEGVVYMGRTPWLLATLLLASGMILLMMGPFEVLVPFAIKDRAGGGPAEHAMVLAAFGIGGAVGSMVVASMRLPRRYLTVMNLLWAGGCIPLVVFGISDQVWSMVLAAGLVGALFNGGVVIWGTLLQRRVPGRLLGRVASLDFFVSLLFMPVSMALAGPVSELVGLRTTFLVAGLAPLLLTFVAIVAARMPQDEIAHPLDVPGDPAAEVVAVDGPSGAHGGVAAAEEHRRETPVTETGCPSTA